MVEDRQLSLTAWGAGVLSSLLPELTFQQVLLLAPATDYPGPRIKKNLLKNYQAQEIEAGLYGFSRKNGTTSYFSQKYVDEFNLPLANSINKTGRPSPTLKFTLLAVIKPITTKTCLIFLENTPSALSKS